MASWIISILVLIAFVSGSLATNSTTSWPSSTDLLTTFPGTTEMYATLNANIRDILLDTYLPEGYDLPENIYDWNVTDIVYWINQEDPELLYTVDTNVLLFLFPEYFISQLPRDILIAHKLYYYLDKDDPMYCNCTSFNFTTPEPCFGVFTKTEHKSIFVFPNGSNDSFECGLECQYSQVMWGLHDNDIETIDTFLAIFTITYLLLCVIIWINHCMDIKFSKERCINRGFLFHAPICIVIMYTGIALSFLIPLIIGKENVICADDIDDTKTVSNRNPGGSLWCTIIGILFYSSEMTAGLYTCFFSIALWKQFYAPLNSIWSELANKRYCKCFCTAIYSLKCLFCGKRNGETELITLGAHSHSHIHSQSDTSVSRSASYDSSSNHNTRCCSVVRDNRIFRKVCNDQLVRHYIIFVIVFCYTLFGFIGYKINSVEPLGICIIGTIDDRDTVMYHVIPQTIFLVLTTLFVPPAILLLIRIASHGNKTTQKSFKKLKWRLLLYFFCTVFAWGGIVYILSFEFYANRPTFREATEDRITCLLITSGNDPDECIFGWTYPIGAYIMIGVVIPVIGLGSLILSCNEKNMKRWKIIFSLGSKNKEPNVLDRLRDIHSKTGSTNDDKIGSQNKSTTLGTADSMNKSIATQLTQLPSLASVNVSSDNIDNTSNNNADDDNTDDNDIDVDDDAP